MRHIRGVYTSMRTTAVLCVTITPVMFTDPMGYWEPGDENRPVEIQQILNGYNMDGNGGLTAAWNNARSEEERARIGETAKALRAFDDAGGEYTTVHLINASSGAAGNGHAAVILQKDNGEGLLFSFYPNPDEGLLSILASSIDETIVDATLHFAVLREDGVNEVLNGTKPLVVGLYHTDSGPKGYSLAEEDSYDWNLSIGINHSQGTLIARTAAYTLNYPGKYSFTARQCYDMALEIMNANGGGVDVVKRKAYKPNNAKEEMAEFYANK